MARALSRSRNAFVLPRLGVSSSSNTWTTEDGTRRLNLQFFTLYDFIVFVALFEMFLVDGPPIASRASVYNLAKEK